MTTFWADHLPNLTVATGSLARTDMLVDMASVPARHERMTLTRTVIGIDVARITHDSGEGSDQVFLGIGVLSRDAFAASGAAIPDPFVMSDYPARGWVWRAAYRVYGFAADQPAVFNRRIDLDIRAQRKLENGILTLAVKNTAFEGTSSVITVSGIIRTLWRIGP